MSKDFGNLQRSVIKPGLCTLCGTCVGVCPTKGIIVNFDQEEPELVGECNACGICYSSCPGKEIPLSNLDKALFGRDRSVVENERFGIVKTYLKGYATDLSIRNAGASGGIATALLVCALEQGIIDAAIVVSTPTNNPWRAKPKIATTPSDIIHAAQSKYVMVPVNSLLNEAVQKGFKKLGIIGCPCHIHALRKMQIHKKPRNITSKIKILLGLFCGTNYSFHATEHILKEWIGLPFDHVIKLEYRGGPQSQDLCVTTAEGKIIRIPWVQYRPFMTAFQRDRCLMCYDWSAELSDVSIGDMFAFEMTTLNKIPRWSGVIVRTKEGENLIDDAKRRNYIKVHMAKEEEFLRNVGFEEKKHGAAYRLIQRKKHGWPTPNYGYSIQLKIRDPLSISRARAD